MTLKEMAEFICGKVNQTEPEDIAACQGFLRRRHEMLWQDQLWKDSLAEYTQTLEQTGYVPSSNWLPGKGVLLLPIGFERILAVRTDARSLRVQRPEILYRIDYDTFNKRGDLQDFVQLSACVWELEESTTLYASRSSTDAGAALTVDRLGSDGVTVSRITRTLTDTTMLLTTTDRLDAITKAVTSGSIAVLANNTPPLIGVLGLGAAVTNAPKRQRIRFVERPDSSVTVRVLGKRTVPEFSAANDEPSISGITNTLLAFAQGDMLQRERQYGKAQALYQEAMALFDQVKRLETVQQAHQTRIIPEGGYGEPFFGGMF
jgi:hypothetical protein